MVINQGKNEYYFYYKEQKVEETGYRCLIIIKDNKYLEHYITKIIQININSPTRTSIPHGYTHTTKTMNKKYLLKHNLTETVNYMLRHTNYPAIPTTLNEIILKLL